MWDKSPVHTSSIFMSRTGQAGLGFSQGTRNMGKEPWQERRSWVLSSLLQSLPHPSSGRRPGLGRATSDVQLGRGDAQSPVPSLSSGQLSAWACVLSLERC